MDMDVKFHIHGNPGKWAVYASTLPVVYLQAMLNVCVYVPVFFTYSVITMKSDDIYISNTFTSSALHVNLCIFYYRKS